MAAPRQSRPGRTLAIFALVVAAIAAWALLGDPRTVKLGLDLRGGTQVYLQPVVEEGVTITQDQLDQTVNIIRQRVDGFGVAEAEVTTQGSGNDAAIVVSVPGELSEAQQDALASTAKLDFRPVIAMDYGTGSTPTTPSASTSVAPSTSPSGSVSPSATKTKKADASTSPAAYRSATGGLVDTVTGAVPDDALQVVPAALPAATTAAPSPSPSPSAGGSGSTTPSASPSGSSTAVLPPVQSTTNDATLQAAFTAMDCSAEGALVGGKPVDATQYLATCQTDGSYKYLLDPATVLGTQITSASAGLQSGGVGGWVVNLSFDSEGSAAFLKTTTELAQNTSPQNQFGIVLDGLVVSAPSVSAPIPGGQAEISGNFTQEEATSLANVLKYGALPLTLQIQSVENVSPTIGEDQLHAGLIAGAVGLLLVVLFLLAYYRALGLVAVASLVVAGVVTYFIFVILGRQLGLSLSLAGVAGAIVAIGITADSFVVYFERIRDEVRDGRTLRSAAELGWVRARRTLLAADFVSFLAAAVLYFISVGNVRGFAFVLGLTTLVDVAVSFFFTYPAVVLIARNEWFNSGHPLTGIARERMGEAGEPLVPATTGGRS